MTITIAILYSWTLYLALYLILTALSLLFGLNFKYENIVLGILALLAGILLIFGG